MTDPIGGRPGGNARLIIGGLVLVIAVLLVALFGTWLFGGTEQISSPLPPPDWPQQTIEGVTIGVASLRTDLPLPQLLVTIDIPDGNFTRSATQLEKLLLNATKLGVAGRAYPPVSIQAIQLEVRGRQNHVRIALNINFSRLPALSASEKLEFHTSLPSGVIRNKGDLRFKIVDVEKQLNRKP